LANNHDLSEPTLGDLISLQEASNVSGLSADHLRRLIERNLIWGKKIGRNWVTTKLDVTNYMEKDRKPGRKPKKSLKDIDK
jgi:hypothetical protein